MKGDIGGSQNGQQVVLRDSRSTRLGMARWELGKKKKKETRPNNLRIETQAEEEEEGRGSGEVGSFLDQRLLTDSKLS